jgi:hypothetical protein
VAVLVCALAPLVAAAAASADGTNGTDVPVNAKPFIGRDGLLYYPAPLVITGANDEKFLGSDYDTACGGNKRMTAKLRGLKRLARTIQRSGRKVVFTVAPTKPLVVDAEPTAELLPHGECAAAGIADERALFSGFSDPHYLPLIQPLLAADGQTFFKTDPHWTTVGGAVYARELARRLDPRLARHQRYQPGTTTVWGLFNYWYGNTTLETAQSLVAANGVRSVTVKDSHQSFSSLPELVFDHSWRSVPERKTWRGHTLLIGDSFTLFALQTLRPLFAHGRFLWSGHVPEDTMVQGIADATTVVIEVVSFLLPGSPLVTPAFRHEVAAALR